MRFMEYGNLFIEFFGLTQSYKIIIIIVIIIIFICKSYEHSRVDLHLTKIQII